MYIKNKELNQGFNPILTKAAQPEMGVDFGTRIFESGDTAAFRRGGETIFALLCGEVIFRWDGQAVTAVRSDVFHGDPVVLHVPRDTDVEIIGEAPRSEVAVVSTDNKRAFSPVLFRNEDLLCASELRGKGLMNDASTRIVRTYFDRSSRPETNFFLGEVVSFPGKWSSFPPHTHVTPEFYHYRFLPDNGFGFSLHGADDAIVVRDGDTGCFPDGMLHSQATAPGYAEWYLWVIRLQDDEPMETVEVEEHRWAGQPDVKYFPDI